MGPGAAVAVIAPTAVIAPAAVIAPTAVIAPPAGAIERAAVEPTNPVAAADIALAPAPTVLAVPAPTPTQEGPSGRVICGRCNGASDASMLYCLYCGASLQAAATTAGRPSDPPIQQRLEQRLIARGELDPFPADMPTLSGARLVTIAKDGAEGTSYPLSAPQIDIGREEGTILLREDPYISPRHIRISRREGGFFARNLDSLNGFFVRLRGPRTLEHADLLLVGLQVLRFEVVKDGQEGFGPAARETTLLFGSPMLPRYARLTERTVEGVPRSVFYLHREETILGREAGDIVFTDDPFMSRRHLSIRFDSKSREFTAVDLNSSNGTYLAARGEVRLVDGDHLRMGQHLFRFEDPEQRQGVSSDGARRFS